jgi:hypothetical protein
VNPRWVAAASVLLLVAVGCRASETTPLPSPDTAAAGASVACADGSGSAPRPADWLGAPDAESGITPIIVSTHVTMGPNRFLYTVVDRDLEAIASADVATSLRLFALDRDAEEPAVVADGTFVAPGSGRGLYRAAVDFPCAGTWGAEIIISRPGAQDVLARAMFRVTPAGTTPAIGAAAPRSQSITAATPADVFAISTDPNPDPTAYRLTIAEAVSSGKPSVVFFATPGFCQSGVCGPTVDLVKRVVGDYRDDLEFVIVEPYVLRETPNGLQPELDDRGRLRLVEAAVDYGIPIEPYLFVVDEKGEVTAKFEVIVAEEELRGALTDVTEQLPTAWTGSTTDGPA